MVRMRAVLLLLACCVARSLAASAAEPDRRMHVVAVAPDFSGPRAGGGRWTIYLDGYIDSAAALRVAGVVERERITDAIVYFNSPGGSLVTAMALGRELRARRYDTNVGAQTTDIFRPRAGACYSACPFAYAGGVRRSLDADSELAVHRAENRVPVADELAFQRVVAGQVADYLATMGISQELLTIMSQVPHDGIRVLTADEAVRLNLVNGRMPSMGAVAR